MPGSCAPSEGAPTRCVLLPVKEDSIIVYASPILPRCAREMRTHIHRFPEGMICITRDPADFTIF